MSQPREGFFETNPAFTVGANLDGTLNALAAGVTAVVGALTNFDPELPENSILTFIDNAGERQFYTVKTVTDDFNIILSQPTRSASDILTDFQIATENTNYFIVRDAENLTFPLADPVLGRIGGGTSSGYRMSGPSLGGSIFINEINKNEGITLKSLYVRNPYQHTWADRSFMLSIFQVDDTGGGETLITELGINGLIFMPGENTEVDLDIYIPPLPNTVGGWGLSALISNTKQNQNSTDSVLVDSISAKMSNVSVPSDMDGLLLPLVIGCRFTYGFTITG